MKELDRLFGAQLVPPALNLRALLSVVRFDALKTAANHLLSEACQEYSYPLAENLTRWTFWQSTCFLEFRPLFEKENKMKQSTKDELKGKVHEVKGAVKEKAGQITSNRRLESEGQDEKLAGKIQKKVGQVEKVLEK